MPLHYSGTPFWHEAASDVLPKHLFQHVEALEESQRQTHEMNLYHACLYSQREELGINWNNVSRTTDYAARAGIVTNNVIKQTIDTASSIIAKNKPRVRVLTMGGNWGDRIKAKSLEKFLWGEFVHRGAYRLGPNIFRDACIFGTGLLKVFPFNGKVHLERALVDEVIVDERDCISVCEPREIFQRKLVDKEVLKHLYPEAADEIEIACKRKGWTSYRNVPYNQVLVIEAWRRPSIPGADDHRHVIVIENRTLLDEGWNKPYFPFVVFRWSEPVTGWYGQGIAEELIGVQVRLNQLIRFIQKCQDLISVPRVFVDVTSGTMKVQIDDRIGAIVPYRGKPPTFFTPQALTAEIYEERERLIRSAFERIGISQLSAQSLKPAGLESAVALREFNEIEGQRFVIEAQRYETFYLDLGRLMIDTARDLYRGGASVKTVYRARNVIETIDWADIDLEEDRFDLSIQAASILTMSSSARMQAVTELSQVGHLSKAESRYLLNHPDLERSDSLAYADFELIEKTIDRLSKGEVVTPEPFQNLAHGLVRVQQALNLAQIEEAPEEILEGFRTWISQAQTLSDMALQASATQQAVAGSPELTGSAGLTGRPEQLGSSLTGLQIEPPIGTPGVEGLPPIPGIQ